MSGTLTDAERRCLQAHARRALEGVDRNRGARERESIWHTKHREGGVGEPLWTPTDLNALEQRGLIIVREEWKDNFVHITEEAFALLSELPDWTTDLPSSGSGRGTGK